MYDTMLTITQQWKLLRRRGIASILLIDEISLDTVHGSFHLSFDDAISLFDSGFSACDKKFWRLKSFGFCDVLR